MRKILQLTFLLIITSINCFSQSGVDRNKAIEIVEELKYHEFYLGNKCYNKTEIDFNSTTERIEITSTDFLGEDQYLINKKIFYLDDIDLSTLVYDLIEVEPNLYYVAIQAKSKGKSIEWKSVEMNKKEFPSPVSKTEYIDKLTFESTRFMPKNLGMKLIENFRIILGADKINRVDLSKS